MRIIALLAALAFAFSFLAPGPTVAAQTGSAPPSIVGHWTGGSSGGPISASRDVTFTTDRYEMTGYPSIGARARYAIVSRTGNALTVRFTETMSCGPCEGRAFESAPDTDVTITFSADGDSITLDGFTLQRQH